VVSTRFILTLFSIVFSVAAHATGTLESINLPPVEKAPWRFAKFPIMAWWGPPGSSALKDFENYRKAGFNIYLANPDTEFEEAIDKATSAGLAIMPFRTIQGYGTKAPENGVEYPVDHPNVVGWLTYDEPGAYDQSYKSISLANELMRKDPTRWALFNCLPPQADPQSTSKLVEAAVRNGLPIISFDNYVITEDGGANEAQHFANVNIFRKLSLKHKVPFWAFALTIKHFHYRRASESDVRWKQFTNLAYGAKGLWYFTYWAPTKEQKWDKWDTKAIIDPADGSSTELYDYVKAINENVHSMGDILLNLTNDQVMHTTGTPQGQRAFVKDKRWIADIEAKDAIVSFFRHKDGTRYAMIVNKQHGKDKSAAELTDVMTVTFAKRVKKVEAIAWLDGNPGPLQLKDQTAKLALAGGTGVLLKFVE